MNCGRSLIEFVFQSICVGRVFHQLSTHIDPGATESDRSRDVRIPRKNSLWTMWMEFPIEMCWPRECWFMVKIWWCKSYSIYILFFLRIVVVVTMTLRVLPWFFIDEYDGLFLAFNSYVYRFLPVERDHTSCQLLSSPRGSSLVWDPCFLDGKRRGTTILVGSPCNLTAWFGIITLNQWFPIKTLWQM